MGVPPFLLSLTMCLGANPVWGTGSLLEQEVKLNTDSPFPSPHLLPPALLLCREGAGPGLGHQGGQLLWAEVGRRSRQDTRGQE
jgi:hypothetical protein